VAITCTIRSITRYVSPDTLGGTQTLFQRSTCEFTVPDPNGSIDIQVGESVTIDEGAYRHFSGSITEVSTDKTAPGNPRYIRITAVDHSQMCDRRIAPPDYSWKDAKANDIFRNICTAALDNEGTYSALHYDRIGSDGVTVAYQRTNSQTTPTVYIDTVLVTTGYSWNGTSKTITFDVAPARSSIIELRYNVLTVDLSLVSAGGGPTVAEFKIQQPETVTESLTRLCKETGSYYFRFDTAGKARFESFATGPVIATISNASGNILAGTLKSRQTREQFANYVRVTYNNYTSVNTETLTADGAKKTFSVAQEIVAAPTVRVNGSYQSVGLKGVDTVADCFWASGSKDIEFEVAPASSAAIEVVYKGKSIGVADAYDGDSIDARQLVEGGSGIYAKAISIEYEVSPDKAQAIADAELARYMSMSTNLTFETDQIVAVPGDRITATVTGVPTGTFVVRQVRTVLLGPGRMRSSLELVSGNFIMDGLQSIAGLGSYQPFAGGIPIERDSRPKIPDVILGVDPVTVSQIEIDGVLKYKLDFAYTVPESGADNRFEAVQLYLDAEGRKTDLGQQVSNAVEGETATFTVIMRLPETDQDWTFYLVSRNWNRSNTPVWITDPVSAATSPNILVEAKSEPLVTDGAPIVTDEQAGQYDTVAETWAANGYYDTLIENLFIDWTAKLPVEADLVNWSGLQIYLHPVASDPPFYVAATGLLDTYNAEPPTAEGIITDRLIINAADAPFDTEDWDVIFCSYDRAGNRTEDVDGFPTGPTVTISIPGTSTVGGEVAPISALTLQERLNALPRV